MIVDMFHLHEPSCTGEEAVIAEQQFVDLAL